MTQGKETTAFRSQEAREVLETPPGWLIRRGNLLVTLLFLMLLFLSGVIRYPEKVRGRVVLSEVAGPEGPTAVMELPAAAAEKLVPGMVVHIGLDHYPAPEWGLLEGTLTALSPAPPGQLKESPAQSHTEAATAGSLKPAAPGQQMEHPVQALIALPANNTSTSGKNLPCQPGMEGDAVISLPGKSLLLRLIPPLANLSGNQKLTH